MHNPVIEATAMNRQAGIAAIDGGPHAHARLSKNQEAPCRGAGAAPASRQLVVFLLHGRRSRYRAIPRRFKSGSLRYKVGVKPRVVAPDNISLRIYRFPKVVYFSSDKTASHTDARSHIELVTAAGGPASGRCILPENGLFIDIPTAGIVDGIAIAGEGAATDQNVRSRKKRQSA